MGDRNNRSGVYKVLILVSILVLPGFLYYLLEKEGSNSYVTLPIYGEKTLTGTYTSRMGEKIPDTLYHVVPEARFVNQEGVLVDFPARDTAISVVSFFYTRCEAFCDELNKEMNRVAERFVKNERVRLYTLTVDTAYDTPKVLSSYSERFAPATKKWDFVTNGEDDVIAMARNGLWVDAVQDTTREAAFIHSSSLILLDSRHRIRGYYDVTHRKEVDRLIDEIKLLLVEEARLMANVKISQRNGSN